MHTQKPSRQHRRSLLAWSRLKHHVAKHKFISIFVAIIAILSLWYCSDWLSFVLTLSRENYTFGASFSPKQAEDFGLDWKANYTALLDDLGIRHFRLMSYWNRYESQRGIYNFGDLDWQMNEAAKRGAKVSLAIGVRQPRWPECHEPSWASKLSGNDWKNALYGYNATVINRYQHHPALESFQLENEAETWWFGTCGIPDIPRLSEEFDKAKQLTDKPIWMSLNDQYGLPLTPPHPDAYGYSVYTLTYNNVIPGTYFPTSPPIWYHRLRGAIITTFSGKPLFVHELQLEPWGPREIKLLSLDEQNITMSTDRIRYNIQFARKIGFQQIDTWGSEWWYWRKVHGDDSIWQAVKSEINASR